MKIGIYIYNQAEVLDFSGPFEVFSTASRVSKDPEPPFQVFLVAANEGAVIARGGFQVLPHFDFAHHPVFDVLIVAGGVYTAEIEKPAVLRWIAGCASSAQLVASVCTGVFLLAAAGVVTGQVVTTHWEDLADLGLRYPLLQVVDKVRWVDEGNIVTSAGISAGIDMSLHLVSRLHSLELAEKTARQMQFDWTGVSPG